jgi:hypothetical protein
MCGPSCRGLDAAPARAVWRSRRQHGPQLPAAQRATRLLECCPAAPDSWVPAGVVPLRLAVPAYAVGGAYDLWSAAYHRAE